MTADPGPILNTTPERLTATQRLAYEVEFLKNENWRMRDCLQWISRNPTDERVSRLAREAMR